MTVSTALLKDLEKERLDEVIKAVQRAMSDPALREQSQRAIQSKIWHFEHEVSAVLSDLRAQQESIRLMILSRISQLVYSFHEHTLDATLARAGVLQLQDNRVHAGSSLEGDERDFDVFCLDAKERLYIILKNYDWLKDFFRLYPLHFYENSFSFVDRIPPKKLPVKVRVVGLGIGGSIAVSGLASKGIETIVGYEKRREKGPHSVSSRYQNASWRAYDIAAKLVDDEAYNLLVENRQRINVNYDDGSKGILTSDRVQIIIGSAIQAALDSARRYGAELRFECDTKDYYNPDEEGKEEDHCDITALFCGARTTEIFPGLKEKLGVYSWPGLQSDCRMWLRMQASDKKDAYCTRGGEVGAEKWHYTIESARSAREDAERILYNLDSQHASNLRKLDNGVDIGKTRDEVTEIYRKQRAQVESILQSLKPGDRFDYIFTNAPTNPHNLAKRAAEKNVVLDGGYTVEIKMAPRGTVFDGKLLQDFNTDLIVCGGDACVPPNPLAAYGATLACEAAGSLVELAVGTGHLNSILKDMKGPFMDHVAKEDGWVEQVEDLKKLLAIYYEARTESENYFQWVQTLICNLYSLPPFE